MAGNGRLSQARLARIAAFVNQFFGQYGRCPTGPELVAELVIPASDHKKAWRPMLQAGLISPAVYSSRLKTCCRPETARRIWELLRRDENARACFSLMMQGYMVR